MTEKKLLSSSTKYLWSIQTTILIKCMPMMIQIWTISTGRFCLIQKTTIASFVWDFLQLKTYFWWFIFRLLLFEIKNQLTTFSKNRNKTRTWLSNKAITLCSDSIQTVCYRMKSNLFLVYKLLFRIEILKFHNTLLEFDARENIVRFHQKENEVGLGVS